MQVGEEELLKLSGKEWRPIPRTARTIPFGYEISEDDPDILEPVIFELTALEEAKKYLNKGHSLRTVAAWLSEVTERPISHNGLRKRIQNDKKRTRKVTALKRWSRLYKENLEKAKELEKRLGTYDPEEYALAEAEAENRN